MILTLLRRLLISVLLLGVVWLAGLYWFMAQIPTAGMSSDEKADVIVVLTGASGRTDQGLELLAAKRAPQLFISGVGLETSINDLIRLAPLKIRSAIAAVPPENIIIDQRAENTIGNAQTTAQWLTAHNKRSIILVTSNFHMPRSLAEFSDAVPNIRIIPSAVLHEKFTLEAWWRHERSRELLLSEYHKYIASRLRHLFIYLTQ